jgi:hypothetical protein
MPSLPHASLKKHCSSVSLSVPINNKNIIFESGSLFKSPTVSAGLIENDAEILPSHYTWKVTFINLIHK